MFEAVLLRLEPFAREFSRHGKQIYLVGGAVRNLLLGRKVQDYDFTTDALPSEVQGLFRKVLPTGLQHGTVTVLLQGESYEVTTFRMDGVYADGRRPDSVTFTPSLEEDLKRRDFTVNALALNLTDGTLVDFHGGQADLQARVLRAIGDPGQRFDEDALRLLRLYRFASQLGFTIEPETSAAVVSRRSRLQAVSKERIREELMKALAGAYPALAWEPLVDLGFLSDLFAPLTVAAPTSQVLAELTALPADLRWAFWLTVACTPGPAAWEPVLKGLKFSNADQASALGPARALEFLGAESVPRSAKAIVEAWGSRERVTPGLEYLSALERVGFWSDSRGLKTELARVGASEEPVFLADLQINGKDLLSEGIAPGPAIGRTLRALQRLVWDDPGLNRTDLLRQRAADLR